MGLLRSISVQAKIGSDYDFVYIISEYAVEKLLTRPYYYFGENP